MLVKNDVSGTDVITNFISSFDNEVARMLINTKDGEEVITELLTMSHSLVLPLFFNPRNIRILIEKIIEKRELLLFLLTYTTRVKTALDVIGVTQEETINMLKESVCVSDNDNLSILPDVMQQELLVDENYYISLCINNYWLLCLYIILLYMQDTQTWETYSKNI